MKKWLIFAASCLGVIALCALIWLVFPLIAVAGVEPFASVWLRLALVLLTVTIFAGVYAWKYYRGRKASAALAAEISKSAGDSSDAKQLADKMADALKTLKTSSKSKGDFLYRSEEHTSVRLRQGRRTPGRGRPPQGQRFRHRGDAARRCGDHGRPPGRDRHRRRGRRRRRGAAPGGALQLGRSRRRQAGSLGPHRGDGER
jgi:hypothetical protein